MCNIKRVFILQHCYEYGENNEFTETKFIGVYSSQEQAVCAINRLKNKKGFKDYPLECFYVDEYMLDKDQWSEGFITFDEA